jgi:hypothetical protein
LCAARPSRSIGVMRIRAALVGVIALAMFPAVAHGDPRVVRIDPSTGAQTVLASGAPWSKLAGIAVDASGTVYVADRGSGISALAAPGFAITPVVSDSNYGGLLVAGSTLFAMRSGSVDGIATTAPFAQRVVTSGGEYQESAIGPMFGALSGPTLYTTTYSSCESAEGGAAEVVAVDTATGRQTEVQTFGCAGLQGIALSSDGTLLVAQSGTNKAAARIVRLNPADASVSTVAKGGSLKDPRGIALDASGRVIVADAISGVLAVSTSTGAQSTLASGAGLTGANGIALDASGAIYVTAAGAPPVLKLSAPSQRFSTAGVRLKASCTPRCDLRYEATVQAKGVYPFGQTGEVTGVGAARALTVKLPKSVNRNIAGALAKHRSVRIKVTATAQDADGAPVGKSVKATVRVTR